jgi:hypothetical protein
MPRGCPVASIEERFLKRCIKVDDCWIWTGNQTTNGYGQLLKKTYGTSYAHQWSCHHFNQSPLPIPKGYCIKHSCDIKMCVNPAHLSYGTVQENIQEMVERNPAAMGRVQPTDEEMELLRQMIAENTPRRVMARRLNHSRQWVDRIRRDYFLTAP